MLDFDPCTHIGYGSWAVMKACPSGSPMMALLHLLLPSLLVAATIGAGFALRHWYPRLGETVARRRSQLIVLWIVSGVYLTAAVALIAGLTVSAPWMSGLGTLLLAVLAIMCLLAVALPWPLTRRQGWAGLWPAALPVVVVGMPALAVQIGVM